MWCFDAEMLLLFRQATSISKLESRKGRLHFQLTPHAGCRGIVAAQAPHEALLLVSFEITMARSHVAAALAIASLGLLITFHLISQFGLPDVGFFRFSYDSDDITTTPGQIPLLPPTSQSAVFNHEPVYLLGVGKADITG